MARSSSGLFECGAFSEPEPEHNDDSDERFLDYTGIRIGREVILGQRDLQLVGRSKLVCEATRSFVAGWCDGQVGSWFNEICWTRTGDITNWTVQTHTQRAKILSRLQNVLRCGRQLLLGAPEEQHNIDEQGMAALCLALLAAAVAKGHQCVHGTYVVEDPGHVLLQRIACQKGAVEEAHATQGLVSTLSVA